MLKWRYSLRAGFASRNTTHDVPWRDAQVELFLQGGQDAVRVPFGIFDFDLLEFFEPVQAAVALREFQ